MTFSLFPNQPVQVTSRYELGASIARLRNAVTEGNPSVRDDGVFGEVSAEYVRLECPGRTRSSQYKPILVAEFQSGPEGVVLMGRFTTSGLSKLAMSIWFLAVLVIELVMTRYTIDVLVGFRPIEAGGWPGLLLPLSGIALFAAGYFVIRLGWNCSRADIETISRLLASVLTCWDDPSKPACPS